MYNYARILNIQTFITQLAARRESGYEAEALSSRLSLMWGLPCAEAVYGALLYEKSFY